MEETLDKKESAIIQLEESLTAEIQDLEDQLTEKVSLLEARQEELNGLRSKLDAPGNGSDGVLTLREEDVVVINLLDHKGEKSITPSMGEEKMAQDLKDTATETERLRAQIQERDTMLAAKETEVKMINRTMEEEVSRQLLEKEVSLRTRESAAKQQEDILTARIHDLENRLREKEALLEEGEGKDRQQSMSDELESLKDELRGKHLLLQARETEVRMIKQSLSEKFRGLERIAQNPAGKDLKKSRLGSFLETIEKKN
jgi:DNA repair exonuclease SbcCD ATPase subunit